ncbi:alanine/glycine:cation symporter family protein [Cloacibacillus evryensis]|uniref:alanine/glycine:cation symporter family protein n=1 Tax=Cloacibacillus evryensis TaxID=508460 RepID=UPI0004474787|nr:amino acid carrier protein [Cloacibacillus evryensis]EXG78718.1 amino acid carrier protein [Cloacibacillus evryensis DSM 19522]MEA5036623.1 amino acid carrier protein [Cloacibacillus evryensis]
MNIGDQIEHLLEYVAWTILWNKYFAVMFLVLGLYLTIGLRFFQFRRFGDIMRNTIGTLFRKKDTVKKESSNNVSSFGAFATALGSTVGNGNIAGVASAIAIGGPGAIFWMWMCALVGMATKMSEIVLTQTYKQKDNTGISRGSAAYYIQKGLVEEKGWKWCKVLSVVFTVAMLSAFYFTPGPYVVAESVQAGFNLSATGAIIFSFIYVILQFIIILGGIKRIIKFAESAVPFMVVAYFGVAFFLILKDIPATIEAFKSIFYYAFNPTAAVGGFAGASIIMTLQVGVARSVYSNEAGWGSAPIIHAAADVDHPARQGLWGAFEVFVDTIIVCTITGLMVVITGVWQAGEGGAGSVGKALSHVYGPVGGMALAIFIFIFSLTTSTGWYAYLEALVGFMVRDKPAETRRKIVKFITCTGPLFGLGATMFFFSHGTVPAVAWMVLDIQSAIPVYVNVIALTLLSPVIFKKVREFETDFLDPEKAAREAARGKLAKE